MAFNGSHGIFLSLALLLTVMATTPYVAKGAISLTAVAMRVTGNLFCTPTGNPSPIGTSPPLVNAPVTVTCPNITRRVTTRTDNNGFFNATIVPPLGEDLTLDLINSPLIFGCQVSVTLPVRSCRVLPVSGILRGVLAFVSVVTDNFLVRTVLSGVTDTVGELVKGGGVLDVVAFAFALVK